MVGQGPAVLTAGAGRVGCFFFVVVVVFFFVNHLVGRSLSRNSVNG